MEQTREASIQPKLDSSSPSCQEGAKGHCAHHQCLQLSHLVDFRSFGEHIAGNWVILNLHTLKKAGAIAAGCTVVIKPSEQTPASSGLLTELLHKYLDNDLVRVVNGGVAETTKVCFFFA